MWYTIRQKQKKEKILDRIKKQTWINEDEKKKKQAEVLVKKHIPMEYIIIFFDYNG